MNNFIPYDSPGLFDSFLQELDAKTLETPLARVGRLIDWRMFEPIVHKAVLTKPKGPGGRPRFEPLLMFKVLVLQRLHSLADDDASFQITDRFSFRAFLGLAPMDPVPNGQTIRDFREDLIAADSFDTLFDTFLTHLQTKHGLGLATRGVIIDATFAEVPKQRNTREENATIKAGGIPDSFTSNPKRLAHKDLEAQWAKKNEQTHYGFKDNVLVDVVDKLIVDAVVTTANVHDSQVIEKLIKPRHIRVFGDSAYASAQIEADLEAKGVESWIHEKAHRDRPLSKGQQRLNAAKSTLRCRVEHVFGHMKGSMKALFQRCIGFVRNEASIKLANLVYNMMRFEQIVRLKLA